ncbi:hypothetical protein [Chloracidobacterium thermophilum]|uniref:hypothetical protein n=1 Tax=Chloracidobacterium thermophilum TaxID=458033 RepID=UPI0007389299|nr:hypothetical protein [Chloracidobacterium thermophilum]
MSRLSVESARRRGAVFEALRQAGFLPITHSRAGDEYIQQRFGLAPKTFWKIIRELEADREVRIAPEGLYFVAPQDRW